MTANKKPYRGMELNTNFLKRCHQCLGERRFGTQMSPSSNGFMVEASAERPASWIKRRFYHPMVLGQLPNAQVPTCRPPRRAQKLRTILRPERLRRLDETLREPRYLHRVGCGGRHVDQPSTSAQYDVRQCGRWPWTLPLAVERSVIPHFLRFEHSARWSKSNGNRYVYQVFGFRNVSYALYPSPVYLWWWWRSKTAHKKLLMDPYTSE